MQTASPDWHRGFSFSDYITPVKGRHASVRYSIREIEAMRRMDANLNRAINGLLALVEWFGSIARFIRPSTRYAVGVYGGEKGTTPWISAMQLC